MDNYANINHQSHNTAIDKVIYELYTKPNMEKDQLEEKNNEGNMELHSVEQDPNHPPFPQSLPSDWLEHQLVHNLIQSYRVEFGIKGNGDPSRYGYYVLETNHGIRDNKPLKLVVLYKDTQERNAIQSYLDTIRCHRKKHWWFYTSMDVIRYLYLAEMENCYLLYDHMSPTHFRDRIAWDPFDEYLDSIIGSPYYKIIGYDEWKTEILQEIEKLIESLCDVSVTWVFPWTREWRTHYTMKKLIRYITMLGEIDE